MLEKINSPEDVKILNDEAKKQLAEEIREYILQTVSENGGHLASNLGVVELTIALHSVFDLPKDTSLLDSFLNSSSIEKREIEGKEVGGKRVSILEKVNQVDDDTFLEETNLSQPAQLDSDVVKIEVTDGRIVEMR